jgi:hypothetical protein
VSTAYITWLEKRGVPVFKVGDTYWEIYKKALIPATVGPGFANISTAEAESLLQESGALLLRYSSDPSGAETDWWYVICDRYDPKSLSKRTRQRIGRGLSECQVRRLEPEWLAQHGYECYTAAFGRYKHSVPANVASFRRGVLSALDGPVEFWGIFRDEKLAGYGQCIVDGNSVGTSVIKLDPAYLDYCTSFALISQMVEHYVGERGMVISNGNRSVAHDTNFQDFLLRLGFRRQFCRLNVIYRPWLKLAVRSVFPLRRGLEHLGNNAYLRNLRALLCQEELKRLCHDRQ